MVNVMGDALATGIMAHICRKEFMKEGDGVSSNHCSSPVRLKLNVETFTTVALFNSELSSCITADWSLTELYCLLN